VARRRSAAALAAASTRARSALRGRARRALGREKWTPREHHAVVTGERDYFGMQVSGCVVSESSSHAATAHVFEHFRQLHSWGAFEWSPECGVLPSVWRHHHQVHMPAVISAYRELVWTEGQRRERRGRNKKGNAARAAASVEDRADLAEERTAHRAAKVERMAVVRLLAKQKAEISVAAAYWHLHHPSRDCAHQALP
jgi:PhoPQ-activated pathogenicity-related protein